MGQKIEIIICTYNRCEELKDVLKSLLCLNGKDEMDHRITIVDNNSSDNTKGVVREFQKISDQKIHYIFEPEQGQAAARNRGIKETDGDVIAFIDDDAIASKNWLKVIYKKFLNSDIDCLTGKVIPLWSCKIPRWYHPRMRGVIVDVDRGDDTFVLKKLMPAVNMAVRRFVFEEYGGFRLDRGEDTEFSCRVVKAGCKILYCPEMLVYHKIIPYRVTKKYFIQWFFTGGGIRYIVDKEYGPPLRRAFNVPLWMYREFFRDIVGWLNGLFACKIKQRFLHEVQLFLFLGYVKTAWVGRSKKNNFSHNQKTIT